MSQANQTTLTVPQQMIATDLPRREFLQLANEYDPAKHDVRGWYISTKFDGMRAFWDGGVSRGLPTTSVPWAGIYNGPRHKTAPGALKKDILPVATGLWSRAANPIMAPAWFLDLLPVGLMLDGELWAGHGQFQETMSICKQHVPDERWRNVRYALYGVPTVPRVFQSGEVRSSQMWQVIEEPVVRDWLSQLSLGDDYYREMTTAMEFGYLEGRFSGRLSTGDVLFVVGQYRLGFDCSVQEEVQDKLDYVLEQGGEGVVLRNWSSCWTPKRHSGVLKYKPFHDAEARVVGFTAGEQGVTGNMLGKIGALIVEWLDDKGVGHTFKIGGGLTMEERELDDTYNSATTTFAMSNPGAMLKMNMQGKHIRLGETITFRYRELTDDGTPREARFYRKRPEE